MNLGTLDDRDKGRGGREEQESRAGGRSASRKAHHPDHYRQGRAGHGQDGLDDWTTGLAVDAGDCRCQERHQAECRYGWGMQRRQSSGGHDGREAESFDSPSWPTPLINTALASCSIRLNFNARQPHGQSALSSLLNEERVGIQFGHLAASPCLLPLCPCDPLVVPLSPCLCLLVSWVLLPDFPGFDSAGCAGLRAVRPTLCYFLSSCSSLLQDQRSSLAFESPFEYPFEPGLCLICSCSTAPSALTF